MTKYEYEFGEQTLDEMTGNREEIKNALTLLETLFGTRDDMKENPELAERQLRERADSGELFKNAFYVIEKLNHIDVQSA
jgi:hypothetical protein